ncbi:hypothetical protein KIPB_007094, partial [Kipferlia bialata]|eukprot:g7094.t1
MSPGVVPDSGLPGVPTRQHSFPPVGQSVKGNGTSRDMLLLLGTILNDSDMLAKCGGQSRIESLLSAVRDQTLFATPKDFQ